MTRPNLNSIEYGCYLAEKIPVDLANVPRRELRELLQYVVDIEAKNAELEADNKSLRSQLLAKQAEESE